MYFGKMMLHRIFKGNMGIYQVPVLQENIHNKKNKNNLLGVSKEGGENGIRDRGKRVVC